MTATLPYVIVVSDGVSIRTLHAPVFEPMDRAQLEAIIARALEPRFAASGRGFRPIPEERVVTPPPPQPSPNPATAAMMTQREIATTSGYSGDACQSCGSFQMKRTGVCLTCEGCGSTSGGCS